MLENTISAFIWYGIFGGLCYTGVIYSYNSNGTRYTAIFSHRIFNM